MERVRSFKKELNEHSFIGVKRDGLPFFPNYFFLVGGRRIRGHGIFIFSGGVITYHNDALL